MVKISVYNAHMKYCENITLQYEVGNHFDFNQKATKYSIEINLMRINYSSLGPNYFSKELLKFNILNEI
jgi:hypothetical protein